MSLGEDKKRAEQQRPCPTCTTMTDFIVTKGYGMDIVQLKGTSHKAPCGRLCAESKEVTIAEALAGLVHHRNNCECLKAGRGYQRPGDPG